MADLKFVKPGEGRTLTFRNAGKEKTVPAVALPGGVIVPAEGAEVGNTLFVRRRLRDGDLVEAARPAPAKTKPAEKD